MQTTGQTQNTDSNSQWLMRILTSVWQGLPTLLVLALLAGIAWWGHHHGWKIPKFSQLVGAEKEDTDPWCDEHGVPEAECIACNAELMPKGELFGWCEEHGVHECVLHHPHLAQLKDTPNLNQSDFERATRAISIRPRTANDSLCKMHLRRIQFPSIEAVNRAGIDIGLVDRGPVIEVIEANGEIVYDQTRVAHLASKVSGTVWSVEKNLGETVNKGDLLALVDSSEAGNKKAELIQALVQYELDKKTHNRISRLGGSVVPLKQVELAAKAVNESEFRVESAIQALLNLGLSIDRKLVFAKSSRELQKELNTLGLPNSVNASTESKNFSTNLVPVLAPRQGIIVSRNTVPGEVVEPDKTIFTVVDTTRMWLHLNVRLEEAERLSIGQELVFRADGSTNVANGHVSWISTEVDPTTRIVRVRGELNNENQLLRNETFGAGEIILRKEDDAIVVPDTAIHWEGCCHVAFVRDKDYFKDGAFKVFHTRSVRPGAVIGNKVEVIAGLLPGEVVVTKGSGILRAELLKGNLGAG